MTRLSLLVSYEEMKGPLLSADQEGGFHQKPNRADTLMLIFQPPELREISINCLSHPV